LFKAYARRRDNNKREDLQETVLAGYLMTRDLLEIVAVIRKLDAKLSCSNDVKSISREPVDTS
jgi:hypothetical protein